MTEVWTGIDVLTWDKYRLLQGSRVGLVTNHTGRTREGLATVDVLYDAAGVSLQALFGPEHGIRGDFDASVADSVDARTGLPVYSLYGARTQPSPEHIAGIDTLIFDIQDIGCRFYTYISTLGNILEAASAYGLRVVILDRPNPITGGHAEGPMADVDKLSFTAYHPIPIRHGLTVGEMARLFHAEKALSCPLEVIPCEGWQRGDWYDATGLLWTNPSPNMRRLSAAALYPGVGLLEMTNVSVGRGTDTPFEVFGAPYIDPRSFAALLNGEDMPGVRFLPCQFTPAASIHQGASCGGVQLIITDRDRLNAVQVGLTLAILLRRLYPDEWQPEKLLTLLANEAVYEAIVQGRPYAEMEAGWARSLRAFVARTEDFRLYD